MFDRQGKKTTLSNIKSNQSEHQSQHHSHKPVIWAELLGFASCWRSLEASSAADPNSLCVLEQTGGRRQVRNDGRLSLANKSHSRDEDNRLATELFSQKW